MKKTLEENKTALASVMARETGKPDRRPLAARLQRPGHQENHGRQLPPCVSAGH